jgi:hypothetical protein
MKTSQSLRPTEQETLKAIVKLLAKKTAASYQLSGLKLTANDNRK